MKQRKVCFLINGRSGQYLAGIKVMTYLPEYPGPAECSSAYHNSINAVPVKHYFCHFRSVHITIADVRNFHSRVVLDLSDEGPVSLAPVQLSLCPTVYCQPCDTCVLQTLRNLNDNLIVFIPPQPCLYPVSYTHLTLPTNREV